MRQHSGAGLVFVIGSRTGFDSVEKTLTGVIL